MRRQARSAGGCRSTMEGWFDEAQCHFVADRPTSRRGVGPGDVGGRCSTRWRTARARPRRRRRSGHRRASSGTGDTPPTLAVIRDEIDAAVRTRTPVDDREKVAVEEFLAVLERLGEDPFDEHANPVHVTASALIVGRRGYCTATRCWARGSPLADTSTVARRPGRRLSAKLTRKPASTSGFPTRRRTSSTSMSTQALAAIPTSICATSSMETTPIPRRRRGRARRSSGAPGPRH